MRTAFNATRLAIAAFIVPYIFAFNNTMLFIGDFSPLDVVQVVLTSSVGMFLIAAGMIGYMLRDLNWGVRIVCIAAGLMLIHPGTLTDIIGIGVLVVVLVFQIITGKGSKAVKRPDSAERAEPGSFTSQTQPPCVLWPQGGLVYLGEDLKGSIALGW